VHSSTEYLQEIVNNASSFCKGQQHCAKKTTASRHNDRTMLQGFIVVVV